MTGERSRFFVTISRAVLIAIVGSGLEAADMSTAGHSMKPSKPENGSTGNRMGKSFTSITHKEVESFRVRWNELKPAHYSYTCTITGFSPNRGVHRIECTDSCRVVAGAGGTSENTASFNPAIEALFDLIKNLVGDRKVTYSVSFDPVYSYPSSISVSWGESLGYEVSDFREIAKQ